MKQIKNWMPEYRWVLGGLGLLVLWLGGSNWISYRNSTLLIESNRQVLKSYEIIQNLTSLYADLTVAESGRRGYVLMGTQGELDRYHDGIANLESELLQLQQHVSPDREQSQRFDTVEPLIQQRINLLAQSIAHYQENHRVDQRQQEITLQSVNLRTQIQNQLTEMKNLEEMHLRQWLKESQEHRRDRLAIEGLWLVSAFGGVCLGLYAVNEQLTQRRQSEAQREKLQQQKELTALKLQFFSMASHEFRTPLSVILGSSQLLLNGQQDPEKLEKNLNRIQTSAKSMTQLLNDILTLARAEAGSLVCQRDRLDLASFCLNLVEDLDLANSHQHPIELVSRSSLSYVNLDERLLYVILSNLLSNAIKYSPLGHEIQLIVETESSDPSPQVIFQVKDQGHGITEADLPNLYQPFYRGQNTGTRAGTGIGLTIVKTCVELHGGTIAVESQVGVGSLFTVTLPILAAIPNSTLTLPIKNRG